eukprot:scaffold22507_cov42-Phaeocystis_antarctica.AAC.1
MVASGCGSTTPSCPHHPARPPGTQRLACPECWRGCCERPRHRSRARLRARQRRQRRAWPPLCRAATTPLDAPPP